MSVSNVPTQFAGFSAPWHQVWAPLPDEAKTDYKLAMKLGGIDFQVITKPMINPFTGEPSPNNYGIFAKRIDEEGTESFAELGKGTERYTPRQNEKMFAFVNDLVDGGAVIDSCGYLGNGETVFMNLITGQAEVTKGDVHTFYMQALQSHDGTSTLDFFQTGCRMVCANTIRHALHAAGENKLSFKATKNHAKRMDSAGELLRLAGMQSKTFIEKLKFLQGLRLTTQLQEEFFKTLFPNKTDEDGELSIGSKVITQIMSQDASNGVVGVNGTLYGMLNQVTAYVDHKAKGRKTGNTAGNPLLARLEYSQFGSGAALKAKALDVLLEMGKTAPSNKITGVESAMPMGELDTDEAPLVIGTQLN